MIIGFTVAICILFVSFGIYVADRNTRSIGYSDMEPVAVVRLTEKGAYLKLFDITADIPDSALSVAETAVSVLKKAAPARVKATAALLDITEKIIALFAQ